LFPLPAHNNNNAAAPTHAALPQMPVTPTQTPSGPLEKLCTQIDDLKNPSTKGFLSGLLGLGSTKRSLGSLGKVEEVPDHGKELLDAVEKQEGFVIVRGPNGLVQLAFERDSHGTWRAFDGSTRKPVAPPTPTSPHEWLATQMQPPNNLSFTGHWLTGWQGNGNGTAPSAPPPLILQAVPNVQRSRYA
jgi:hypothetical protein